MRLIVSLAAALGGIVIGDLWPLQAGWLAMAALLADLKVRGMLDDTLVIWGGEFGRTSMRENRNGRESEYAGRDHNCYWRFDVLEHDR